MSFGNILANMGYAQNGYDEALRRRQEIAAGQLRQQQQRQQMAAQQQQQAEYQQKAQQQQAQQQVQNWAGRVMSDVQQNSGGRMDPDAIAASINRMGVPPPIAGSVYTALKGQSDAYAKQQQAQLQTQLRQQQMADTKAYRDQSLALQRQRAQPSGGNDIQSQRLAETERHNRAMEANATARTGGVAPQAPGAAAAPASARSIKAQQQQAQQQQAQQVVDDAQLADRLDWLADNWQKDFANLGGTAHKVGDALGNTLANLVGTNPVSSAYGEWMSQAATALNLEKRQSKGLGPSKEAFSVIRGMMGNPTGWTDPNVPARALKEEAARLRGQKGPITGGQSAAPNTPQQASDMLNSIRDTAGQYGTGRLTTPTASPALPPDLLNSLNNDLQSGMDKAAVLAKYKFTDDNIKQILGGQ